MFSQSFLSELADCESFVTFSLFEDVAHLLHSYEIKCVQQTLEGLMVHDLVIGGRGVAALEPVNSDIIELLKLQARVESLLSGSSRAKGILFSRKR